jgi:hypothetical protein
MGIVGSCVHKCMTYVCINVINVLDECILNNAIANFVYRNWLELTASGIIKFKCTKVRISFITSILKID